MSVNEEDLKERKKKSFSRQQAEVVSSDFIEKLREEGDSYRVNLCSRQSSWLDETRRS